MSNALGNNALKLAKPAILALVLIVFAPIFGSISAAVTSQLTIRMGALVQTTVIQHSEGKGDFQGTFLRRPAFLQ